ncbi:Protein white [Blattella germanica]|nr:Protein white [Blattella germanica]
MTKNDDNEQEFLLDPSSRQRKHSYNSVNYEREATLSHRPECAGDCEVKFCMKNLSRSRGSGDGNNGGGSSSITPEEPAFSSDRISYTWRDVNVYTANAQHRRQVLWFGKNSGTPQEESRKHILKNVNGLALPGELLAIMGSSGAGKTTLLNTLMFRSSPNLQVSGHRALNGAPVSSSALASLSAYVQQDDLFIGTLTVKEHLVFQALVRMDRDIPYRTRMTRVNDVISELALTKCQDTVIGIPGRVKGISGGEMKRLSFASEVLTNPPLMFCDEPTSGLDSFMAHNVVSVLKNMALKGKTVVATIHQPSSEVFAMFDKVLLMAEGRVAFLGSTEEACKFFRDMGVPCPSNYNPADFFIQVLAAVPTREDTYKQTVDMVCDTFKSSEIGERILAQVDSQEEMVSVLIGLIYYGQELTQEGVMNINGALFIFLTNMTFQNVFAVITVSVLLRDASLPTRAFQWDVPGGRVLPLQDHGGGSHIRHPSPNLHLRHLLLGGAQPKLPPIPRGQRHRHAGGQCRCFLRSVPGYFKWLSYLSWFKYGNEALLINQWADVQHIQCTHSNTTCPKNGHVVLETLDFKEDDFTMDIACLVALIFAFRIFAYLALLSKTFRKD